MTRRSRKERRNAASEVTAEPVKALEVGRDKNGMFVCDLSCDLCHMELQWDAVVCDRVASKAIEVGLCVHTARFPQPNWK